MVLVSTSTSVRFPFAFPSSSSPFSFLILLPILTLTNIVFAAKLVPLVVVPAPSSVDDLVFFNSSFAITDDELLKWSLNNVTYESTAYKCAFFSFSLLSQKLTFSLPRRSPLLQQVVRGETLDSGRVATVTTGMGVIDMVINNVHGPDHPFVRPSPSVLEFESPTS
jgi:hypothetical protein